jgi:hypothetical protein
LKKFLVLIIDLLIVTAFGFASYYLIQCIKAEFANKQSVPERNLAVVENRIKIAVIDTGIDFDNREIRPYLCSIGHRDFTKEGLKDNIGHGSNVSEIISRNLDPNKYCILILKYHTFETWGNLKREVEAFKYSIEQNVKYINLSSGGRDKDQKELEVIKQATDKGIKVIVAAGNDSCDLSKNCNFFPACYSLNNNFYVIGNCGSKTSNFNGPVKQCEDGNNVCAAGFCMSGTSQATAIFTNKLILKENL